MKAKIWLKRKAQVAHTKRKAQVVHTCRKARLVSETDSINSAVVLKRTEGNYITDSISSGVII